MIPSAQLASCLKAVPRESVSRDLEQYLKGEWNAGPGWFMLEAASDARSYVGRGSILRSIATFVHVVQSKMVYQRRPTLDSTMRRKEKVG